MPTLSGLPYFEIAFDRDAALVDAGQVDAVVEAAAAPGGPTDVVVLSHGWNDDANEARALYAEFGANFVLALVANGVLPARRVQVVGVLWPSKRFDDADLALRGAPRGGAPRDPATDTLMQVQLARLEALTGADLSSASAAVPRLRESAAARGTFVGAVLTTLPASAAQEDSQPARMAQASADPHFLDRLGTPLVLPPAPTHAPTHAGAAAGIGDWFAGVEAGAINLLNYTTYYVMKDRAGRVGRDGVAPVLAGIRAAAPAACLHLVGHSFGARLVTAAAAAGAPATVDTLSLLQAAFSHFAFARDWDGANHDGLFRPVVAAPAPIVRGPSLVTFTRNDHVVGIAYAIASRVAGQIASAIGDAHDPYGALGSNGALRTPEATTVRLAAGNEPYAFATGIVYNLDANGTPGDPGVISSHGDVCRPEVAHAVADAVRAAIRYPVRRSAR